MPSSNLTNPSPKALFLVWLSLVVTVLVFIMMLVEVLFPQRSVRPVEFTSSPLMRGQSPSPSPQPVSQPAPARLETVLNADHTWTATLSAEQITTIIVTGDVLLAREVNFITTGRQDFHWPFAQTAQRLHQADITVVNLETPLIANCPPMRDRMIFCGDPRNVEGLTWSGVDVASLANNHALNQGPEGVDETVAILEAAQIAPAGLPNRTAIVTRNGIRFAFPAYTELGATQGKIQPTNPELIRAEITQLRQQADVVIPFFHWGVEYTYQPTVHQRELAHLAIDAGADLVIGNHPHWYQKLEEYNGKLIMYSHGNFVFDQMWSLETRQGLVGQYLFYEDTLVDAQFWPVLIEDYGQPRWLEGENKEERLQHWRSISRQP